MGPGYQPGLWKPQEMNGTPNAYREEAPQCQTFLRSQNHLDAFVLITGSCVWKPTCALHVTVKDLKHFQQPRSHTASALFDSQLVQGWHAANWWTWWQRWHGRQEMARFCSLCRPILALAQVAAKDWVWEVWAWDLRLEVWVWVPVWAWVRDLGWAGSSVGIT